MSSGERGRRCVFWKDFWVIVVDDSSKASHVSMRKEFIWRCKLEDYMVSYTVHSCITIKILELHIWTVIVWLVMHRITCLEYEILDFVSTKYAQCPITKMAVMAIIEEHLGI